MQKNCESPDNLLVYPKKGSAVLFYSQNPYCELDPKSEHGGCPVYKGLKFAANLWVWNKDRDAGEGEEMKRVKREQDDLRKDEPVGDDGVAVTLVNRIGSGFTLWWSEHKEAAWQEWGQVVGAEEKIGTFHTHGWQARVDGEPVWETWLDRVKNGGKQRLEVERGGPIGQRSEL